MSIQPVTMYTACCNGCGKLSGQESTEFAAWKEPFAATKEACEELGWIQDKALHYCPDCTEWNEEETELIPKKEVV